MHISLTSTTRDGQNVTLSLHCEDLTVQQESDLGIGEARSRLNFILDRELRRMTEIIGVALADAHMARRMASVARQSGKKEKQGPAQILGAGTKDQANRLIEHKGRMIPATELKTKGA